MENPNPVRVLVVEDNLFDQELFQHEMRKTSFADRVLFLADPREALNLFRGPEADQIKRNLVAIFLDVHLPYMSGVELLEVIRSMDGMENLPVMVMTSAPHPDTIAACQRLKVNAFVEKPVKYTDFSKVIANLFHRPPR